MRVFIDMDGVLADFTQGVCTLRGIDRNQLESKWALGEWDMTKPLGLTEEEFWTPIHVAGDTFWSTLPETPHAIELIIEVTARAKDWHILSSPSRSTSSHVGKIAWLRNRFGDKFTRFLLTNHKYLLAKPGTVLIDDSDRNVDQFRDHGGEGVLFPQRWNSAHEYAADPLPYVFERLDKLIKGAE